MLGRELSPWASRIGHTKSLGTSRSVSGWTVHGGRPLGRTDVVFLNTDDVTVGWRPAGMETGWSVALFGLPERCSRDP